MASYAISERADGILVSNLFDFSLPEILDCGQCFRWVPDEQGGYSGIAMGRHLTIRPIDSHTFLFCSTDEKTFREVWAPYFDLEQDYGKIKELLSQDPVLQSAAQYAPGIRILRQDSWETLCTFIISQNNNIKRIRGIVERLCETFGEPIDGGFSFPTPQRLAKASLEELAPLRSGFRAKYLLDAAQKVVSNEVDLSAICTMEYQDAKDCLCKIYGVGPKVADCVLLFGFYRLESFPMDVWMKRAMSALFPKGLPSFAVPYSGIAQQYIFHYARTCPDSLTCQEK